MCLENEKKPNKEYKSCWKVFFEKDGELHSPVKGTDVLYTKGIYKADYGFHGFIKKKDATIFLKLIKGLFTGSLSNRKPKGSEPIIKKIEINDVVMMGYACLTSDEVFGKTDVSGKSDNALRFKEMVIGDING